MPRQATGQVVERTGKRGTVFALRFRAGGRRRYVTTTAATRQEAEEELERTLAAVKLGIWKPPEPEPVPGEPEPIRTLHEFASAWVQRNRGGVDERTVEFWTWALSHVLEHLASLPITEINVERVDAYKAAKLAERERLLEALRTWQAADLAQRGPRPPQPLSNASINRTLRVLGRCWATRSSTAT